MKVCASQPVVFGYTAPRKIRGNASSTDINKEIEEVSAAIQASIMQNNTNKTVIAAGGIGLLVIAALAYQNYNLSQENAGLAAAINQMGGSSSKCSYSYEPKMHEQFGETPFEKKFELDIKQGSPWCLDILTYGNKALKTPQQKKVFLENKFNNRDQLVAHLSQQFLEPVITKGNVNYYTGNPSDDPERKDNMLGMLIEHNCINTVQGLIDVDLLKEFDLNTLQTAKRQATRALSPYTVTLLRSIAAKSPNSPLSWGMGADLAETDGYDAYDAKEINIKVHLTDYLPEHLFGPHQHHRATQLQRSVIETDEFKIWFKAYLTNLLERKDSEGNPINIEHEAQQKRVLRHINSGLSDNRPYTVALLKQRDIATLVNSNELTRKVQELVEGSSTAVSVY